MEDVTGHGAGLTLPYCLLLLASLFIFQSQVECKSSDVEGFFQGRCGQMSPCSQICTDLTTGGFICECQKGYKLHTNGFSCIEITPNPATTIPSVLYDLEAEEVAPERTQVDDDDDVDDDERSSYKLLSDVADDAETLDSLAQSTSQDNNMEYELPDPDEGNDDDDGTDNEEEHLPEHSTADPDIVELKALTKRGRDRDRDRGRGRGRSQQSGRNRAGGRRKGKDKNRKGKGRDKGRVPNYFVNVYGTQQDMPMNDVYVKAGKPGKDKSSMENEIQTISRYMTCVDIHCQGGGRCIPDEMRAGGGVRCQCPLGRQGLFCEQEIIVRYPKFMGTGYMAFPVLRGAYRDMSISIEFKPDTHNGLLLYSGDFPHPMSDFFSVALVDGFIEFRFDCGTGMARIRTHNKIELGQWNIVEVKRSDWYGWLKLNDGAQERGRSKGLFSRITFREDLYLGGYKNTSTLGSKTGMQWGFVGCVRHLEINGKVYDMRQGAFVGDAIHGMDVGECSSNVCDSIRCNNGGTCIAESADTSICLCPLGTAGDRCESRIDVHVPSFTGHSYLEFLGLGQSALSYLDGEVVLKPTEPTGLILYNGYTADRTGDFVSLAMSNGFVDFRFDLGTGPAVIRSREPISMNEWHVIKFRRTGRNGELSVDNQAPVGGLSKGGYTQLTLTLDLFVGGHRNFDEVAKKAQIRTAFRGCIQKVVISERPLKLMEEALSGVNIDNCEHPCKGQPCMNGGKCIPIKDYYQCSCPVGFENSNCEDRIVRYRYRYRYRRDVSEPITVPMFRGTSSLQYKENKHMHSRIGGTNFDLQMKIKTRSPDGLLFWVSEERMYPSSDFTSLGLEHGYAVFSFNLGDGPVNIINNNIKVDDGKWHKLRAQRFEQKGFLEVDHDIVEMTSPGHLKQLHVQSPIYIGGAPDLNITTLDKYRTGFYGCISNVTLNTDLHIDLIGDPDHVTDVQQCTLS